MSRMLALAILFLAATAGCDNGSGTGSGSGPTTATTGGGAAPSEVRIGYFANLTHAQAVLGVASKDFENAVAPATTRMPRPRLLAWAFNAGPGPT